MLRTSELKSKEVINIVNGESLGRIIDVDVDLSEGNIEGIVVPGEEKLFNLFSTGNDNYIPWSDIYKIGEDVILIKLEKTSNLEGGA